MKQIIYHIGYVTHAGFSYNEQSGFMLPGYSCESLVTQHDHLFKLRSDFYNTISDNNTVTIDSGLSVA